MDIVENGGTMGKDHERNDEELKRSSDTNTDSARVLMTKRAIFAALRDLVAKRDFGSITASDIMELAGVSRSTFYRCFSDKYDVVNWAYKRYKNIRVQDKDQYFSFQTSLRAQLDHLSDNRSFFMAALRFRGQNSLHDFIVETNEEYMEQCWHAAHGADPSFEERAAIRFAAAGCSHIIETWLLDGCIEQPDDVVSAICTCIPQEVLDTLY